MFRILKVSTKMQNQLEFKTVSVRLYKYMCEEVVGPKKIVRYRRLYYELHDDMMDKPYYEFISSFDLPGSDFDTNYSGNYGKFMKIFLKTKKTFYCLTQIMLYQVLHY